MAGASTFFHGVFGVVISGLMAASEISGRSFDELLKEEGPELVVYPAEQPEAWAAPACRAEAGRSRQEDRRLVVRACPLSCPRRSSGTPDRER